MPTYFVTELQERLDIAIEQLRDQMVALGTEYGFLHPEVQQCSRELDQLILQYYAMQRKQ
ncbi:MULTISPECIES: aspartyl-phosphate phosphatase Spo0E family protein [Paenibacillus]|uniref:Aspartyl-phosphate phosphatase Spo0E family protein n=1 Tax=Paenibacillus chondroitinus TaxID=59842 RepID=A0ABU6D3M2_9BACL|nr:MULTISPECIES: aspartyl-phosphate phosphatase Spo0E family protein [Paenibacillus]MCY9660877.1 aspartyl-phosphate phosphatase Spo0E family protein [Paenibacillus anseongense]MEB4792325.1 aspartyl-phosphate phosphatase Spo0E family protein [Paenibacillus chondroitinus]